MSVQMIELEEIQMVEASDERLEAIKMAAGATTNPACWNYTAATASGCGAYCL